MFCSLNTYDLIFTGTTWCYDLLSRVNLNESFLNLFNFYWTSFTYLPTFFFYTMLVIFLFKLNRYLIVVVHLFVIYNVEVFDFLVGNYFVFNINITYSNFNLLLVNNLNKYHPFIYYISVIFMSLSAITLLIRPLVKKVVFSNINLMSNIYLYFYLSLVVNITALFLGSWWALQEGTWGGWWNWDPSEVFGLIVTLTNLLYIHQKNSYLNNTLNATKFALILSLFIFVYFFIQLNFDLVSHNFGAKFSFFFSNNLFYLEVVILFLIGALAACITNKHKSNQFLTLIILNDKFVTRTFQPIFYLHILFILLLLLSFLPLVNYFIWTYFSINSFNFINSYDLIIAGFLLILVCFYNSWSWLYFPIIYCTLIPFSWTLIQMLFFLPFSTKTFVSSTHLMLIYFVIVNIFSNHLSFIYWYTYPEASNLLVSDLLYAYFDPVFVCDHLFIELHNLFYNHCSNPSLSSTIIYNNSSSTIHKFFLLYDKTNFLNYYKLSTNYLQTYILVETNYINNLYDVIVLYLIISLKFFKQSKILKTNY